MDKNTYIKKLIKNLDKEKIRDYLYPTIFFLAFSVFIVFAIKPSLSTVFKLINEEKTLNEKNKKYQDAVDYVSMNLSVLESLRDSMYLLNESYPNTPQVNKIIEDIYKICDESEIVISNLDLIKPIEYSLIKQPVFKNVGINVEASGSFDKIVLMLNKLRDQRRIKTIKNIDISSKNKISSESGTLNIKLEIEGYYL
jgi:Tfp pilus assembly protein PilO